MGTETYHADKTNANMLVLASNISYTLDFVHQQNDIGNGFTTLDIYNRFNL